MIWPLFLQLIISYSSLFHLCCNHVELLSVFWIPHALSSSRKKEKYVLLFLLKHFLSCSSHRYLFLLILNVWLYMLGLQKGHSWSFSPSLLSFIVLIIFILKNLFQLICIFLSFPLEYELHKVGKHVHFVCCCITITQQKT